MRLGTEQEITEGTEFSYHSAPSVISCSKNSPNREPAHNAKNRERIFEEDDYRDEGGIRWSRKGVLKQYICMILQHPKRWANLGSIHEGGTQVRPRRAEITEFASFCGRWADLANCCSSRRFRSRAVVPLRLPGPLVCSGPERFPLAAPSGPVRRRDGYMQALCRRSVVGH